MANPTYERVNLTFEGKQSAKAADGGAMSADGRYVVFTSTAADILGGGERGSEVYLRDMQTGRTQLISKAINGESNGEMDGVGITADGRYVVYSSKASNLVEGDTDGLWDVFVFDRHTGQTKMVSDSTQYDARSDGAVSRDGSVVAFFEDRGKNDRVFAQDLETGEVFYDSYEFHSDSLTTPDIQRVTKAANFHPDFSAAGYWPVQMELSIYDSYTGGLMFGSHIETGFRQSTSNVEWNVYLPDGAEGLGPYPFMLLTPLNKRSQQSNTYFFEDDFRVMPSISYQEGNPIINFKEVTVSADGRLVVMATNYNIKTGTPLGGWAIIVYDRQTGLGVRPGTNEQFNDTDTQTLAFIAGATGNPFSEIELSPNSRYVTFVTSEALTADDTNGVADIYRVENPMWTRSTGFYPSEDAFPTNRQIIGTPQPDQLVGTADDEMIDGLAGDDELYGWGGDDEIYGREGDDHLFGGLGADLIVGGDGADYIVGDDDDDAPNSNAHADRLFGGDGADIIYGEQGDDEIYGGQGVDQLSGGDGDDLILGGTEADFLMGEAGDDRLEGEAGDDVIRGGRGDDKAYAGEGVDLVEGGGGDDVLHGDQGADTLYGDFEEDGPAAEEGDDEIFGGDGDDVIWGGGGDDALVGGAGKDFIHGESGDDRLFGSEGDDTLHGGQGDDQFVGGEGYDRIDGGSDDDGEDVDIVLYESTSDFYRLLDHFNEETGQYETIVYDTLDFFDVVTNVEHARFGSLATNVVGDRGAGLASDILEFAHAAAKAYEDEATLGNGWRALSALELGIPIDQTGADGTVYRYMNGSYRAAAPTSVPTEITVDANAQVYFGVVDGQNTLMLAFRGTDQLADLGDYPKFDLHYARYAPLIDAVLSYVEDSGHTSGEAVIDRVMVTGHSLGGAMAQLFMQDPRVVGDARFSAATFGSPGAEHHARDPRIVHFEHAGDLVPYAGDIARALTSGFSMTSAVAAVVDLFTDNPIDFRTAGSVVRLALQQGSDPRIQHSVANYLQSITNLAKVDAELAELDVEASPVSPTNLVIGTDGQDVLEGAGILLPALLRGPGYFGGSEIFMLGGGGVDTVTGGSGDDIFAEYLDELHLDTITDFGAGDEIWLLGSAGEPTPTLNYEAYSDSRSGGRLTIGSSVINILGWHPGEFTISRSADNGLVVGYEGLLGLFGTAVADVLSGGSGDDLIEGGAGDDALSGGAGADRLVGGAGSDTLAGGAGDDEMWGSDAPSQSLSGRLASASAASDQAAPAGEIDTAVYGGSRNQYRATVNDDGVVTLTDLRAGAQSEGVDTLHGFEAFAFQDRTYNLEQLLASNPGSGPSPDPDPNPNPNPGQNPNPDPGPQNPGPVQPAGFYEKILGRVGMGAAPSDADAAMVARLGAQVDTGAITLSQFVDKVVALQDDTTAVALQTYQFFTGRTPNNLAQGGGLEWLVNSEANDRDLNDAYFAAFNQESRYINFAVNLALDSASAGEFAADYGAMAIGGFLTLAYDLIIGTQTAAANGVDVSAALAFLGRAENIDFLTRLAPPSANGDLFIKAALVGQMLSIGAGTDFGRYSAASDRYLTELALDQGVTDAIDMIARYSPQQAPWADLDWA